MRCIELINRRLNEGSESHNRIEEFQEIMRFDEPKVQMRIIELKDFKE